MVLLYPTIKAQSIATEVSMRLWPFDIATTAFAVGLTAQEVRAIQAAKTLPPVYQSNQVCLPWFYDR